MYFPLGYLIHLPSCFDLLRVKVMKVNLFIKSPVFVLEVQKQY